MAFQPPYPYPYPYAFAPTFVPPPAPFHMPCEAGAFGVMVPPPSPPIDMVHCLACGEEMPHVHIVVMAPCPKCGTILTRNPMNPNEIHMYRRDECKVSKATKQQCSTDAVAAAKEE